MKTELTTEDKQRIRQAAELYTKNTITALNETETIAMWEGYVFGAEYATIYEREQHDAESERWAERSELQGKVDAAYDWLWQYNEELKSTNVFHKNEAIIGRITKLLNSLKTK